eukprot:Protomagalhaensia_sp_Gyna_25__1154@NODE_1568_length_1726_cov_34_653231_g1275_i0_p2_GENE_NODE_1568_length_1726_cov_34_653231_g1275_i0NODE_1568_length_1726_cov_34_653231_g1275_i0_p2_ORF_typecomplete_len120_score4_36_NODE_1568_length_1726_cov_34_653231_g1275_i0123482
MNCFAPPRSIWLSIDHLPQQISPPRSHPTRPISTSHASVSPLAYGNVLFPACASATPVPPAVCSPESPYLCLGESRGGGVGRNHKGSCQYPADLRESLYLEGLMEARPLLGTATTSCWK